MNTKMRVPIYQWRYSPRSLTTFLTSVSKTVVLSANTGTMHLSNTDSYQTSVSIWTTYLIFQTKLIFSICLFRVFGTIITLLYRIVRLTTVTRGLNCSTNMLLRYNPSVLTDATLVRKRSSASFKLYALCVNWKYTVVTSSSCQVSCLTINQCLTSLYHI
uniref:Uncharacterized protein n=1 Tax=Cacopsylla melanoneura TaxID=428564 RepID=A0A8D9BC12_9HEMI